MMATARVLSRPQNHSELAIESVTLLKSEAVGGEYVRFRAQSLQYALATPTACPGPS